MKKKLTLEQDLATEFSRRLTFKNAANFIKTKVPHLFMQHVKTD